MDGRLVAPRIPAIPMYGQPFNAAPFPAGYLPYGAGDASAFYSPLAVGDNAEAWRAGIAQAAAVGCYDPAFAAAHYGYGYGPMIGDGARRKNATRETTSTLKAWLNEHRKNPYPTKGEKIMLAIITKMTLTQVSTWFANARRRLKKENKMTWSPRNRCEEDGDDDVIDGDEDNANLNDAHLNNERDRCRSASPTRKTSTENASRLSSFDLPHQPNLHPFLSRPQITGSFTIQRPADAAKSTFPLQDDGAMRRSATEDEEDVDLESVDEDRKDSAFIKRSRSTDFQTEGVFHRRSQSPKSATKSHQIFHQANQSVPPQSQNLQSSSLGQSKARRDSFSPRPHPYSRNVPFSHKSSSLSRGNSPSKPKIWSLADVATENDSKRIITEANIPTNISISKSSPRPGISAMFGVPPRPLQGIPAHHHQPPLNPEAHATLRNWMDGIMQQKMAAVAAAAAAMSGGQGPPPAFFPGGLLPQHLGMNPAAIAMAASLPRGPDAVRFPHAFPGIAELAAAQRAQFAASQHATDLHTANIPRSKSPLLSAHKQSNDASTARHRMVSSDEKRKSPIAASPNRLEVNEMSAFTALNNRPRSGDSGIASAESNKGSLTQSQELNK